MTTLRDTIENMLSDDSGLSSVEYALLLAFIAGGVVLAVGPLANAVTAAFTKATACMSTPPGPACV